MVDLYQILGVSRTSSQAEIKKAYHRLALKYHPDTGESTASAEMFHKINKAYQILSEPTRRDWYNHRLSSARSVQKYRNYRRRKARAMAYARYRYYAQKAAEQRQVSFWKRKDFLLAAVSLLVIFLGVYLFNDMNSLMIKRHDTKTIGKVYSIFTDRTSGENLHYGYKPEDTILMQHESRPTGFTNDRLVSAKGIPIRGGYEFLVWYNPNHPSRSVMDFEHPTKRTKRQILNEAVQILEVKENLPKRKAQCIVRFLYSRENLETIGHILCSDFNWFQNLSHNSITYRNLKNSDIWEKALKQCN